ncbi:MAG: 6-hydroxymethylpterin diphosphokinase MptE-like protein [Salinispira sp.]
MYSITYGNTLLHSLRNPWKEAERIVRSQLEHSNFSKRVSGNCRAIFFLLNPGLAYGAAVLLQYYPKATIHAVYSDRELYSLVMNCNTSCTRQPGIVSSLMLSDFKNYIFSTLTGLTVLQTQVIDWLPSSSVSGHRQLLSDYRLAMREIQAGLLSRMYFGKPWMKNISLNIHRLSKMKKLTSLSGSVFLCAAGPSLNNSMELIKRLRSRVHVWALSSSVRALVSEGIIPDCIVSTDGGYWAGLHLQFSAPESHIIMSLNARVPAAFFHRCASTEFVLMNMPFLKNSENKEFMTVPERGSVIFTALDILERLHEGPIVLLGADFTPRGLQSHARPQAFDEFIESEYTRLHPLTTERFERISGEQLNIYSEWFRTEGGKSISSPMYRWRGSRVRLPVTELTSEDELKYIVDTAPRMQTSWETISVKKSDADVFINIPKPLPGDLFSQSDHLELLEAIVYVNGIELKNQYTHWLKGTEEELCLSELENNL